MYPSVGILECVEDVKAEDAPGSLEPSHVGDIATTGHDADPAFAVRFVHPVIAAGLTRSMSQVVGYTGKSA